MPADTVQLSVKVKPIKYSWAAPAGKSQLFSTSVAKGTLATPARKSQLFSTSVVKNVHFGSSSSKVATFEYKYRGQSKRSHTHICICTHDGRHMACQEYMHIYIYIHIYIYMGMCFFDVAVPGGWYKGYESQVWFGVWLGGMARAPLNSCFGHCKAPARWQLDSRENLALSCYKPAWGACERPELDSCHSA